MLFPGELGLAWMGGAGAVADARAVAGSAANDLFRGLAGGPGVLSPRSALVLLPRKQNHGGPRDGACRLLRVVLAPSDRPASATRFPHAAAPVRGSAGR